MGVARMDGVRMGVAHGSGISNSGCSVTAVRK